MSLAGYLRARDPDLAALRRSARAGILVPSLLAIGVEVLGDPTATVFAAFGSIAMLLFVDFHGPLRERLAAQGCLVAASGALVCLGTLASASVWSATVVMVLVGFAVLFSGVVSSTLAGASTALLVSFVLPLTLPAPPGSIPGRLAGWLLAGAASVLAIGVLWPAPARDPLRAATAGACAALARRLRAEVVPEGGGPRERHVAEATAAVDGLRTLFFGTPYRPTGLSTAARTLVRLVDQVVWLAEVLTRTPPADLTGPVGAAVCEVKRAAADLLEHAADALSSPAARHDDPAAGARRLAAARAALERVVTLTEPTPRAAGEVTAPVAGFLEPGFRAQEMSFVITELAGNAERVRAAYLRTWGQRVLGRGAPGTTSSLSSARERVAALAERHAVWLHNSLRGAVCLGLAVLVARLADVQHSFWVVFGTIAVLRSSALLTGQSAARALAGTVGGIVVGGALIFAVGPHKTVLWALLPLAVLFAGLAPAAISFAAGQAGFTAALLILFDIIEPAGWSIGLVRIQDVAIGCAVSVGARLLFWPRGAGPALGQALAEAFTDGARYVRASVAYGLTRCDGRVPPAPAPVAERHRGAAAARRLDDAFREFLAERGTKSVSLPRVTSLITAVAVLRLTADAVLDLWGRDVGARSGDRTAAREELLDAGGRLVAWYDRTAHALTGHGTVPDRQPPDPAASTRLVRAVRRDLGDPYSARTAVRLLWTADHIEVARRLQRDVVGPARAIAARWSEPRPAPGRRARRR